MDTSNVGRVVASLMEDLATQYEDAEDIEIGTIVVVAEVRGKSIDKIFSDDDYDPDDFGSRVHIRSNDGRHWVQRGLLDWAIAGFRPLAENEE